MEKQNIIDETTKDRNILSITFFLVTVLITLGLLTYNYFIDKNISSINTDINATDVAIAEVNKDDNIKIYKLISSNKVALQDLKSKSNITGFIKHLNNIKEWYNIELKGFNYQNGKLNSSITIPNGPKLLSYDIAEKFIREYRTNKNSIFDLLFVNSITGNDRIDFNISLSLKKGMKN